MTHEDALEKLTSDLSHDRFLAARALSELAKPNDLEVLIRARHVERDAYVRSQLIATIDMCRRAAAAQQTTTLDAEHGERDSVKQARAHAVEWVAGMLLHEIGSKLGLVALAASQELPQYQDSKTKRHVRNLQAIFDAIEQLRRATNTPRMEQFDLAELIDEVAKVETDATGIEVSLVGMRPLMVSSSRQLLRLALCNGVRNAMEAVSDTKLDSDDKTRQVAPVVIAWGITNKEVWTSVVDYGPGLSGSPITSFEIGKTTKSGHPGFGLAIARQALETLNGEVSLAASPGGGAKYEMRWGKNL